MGQPAIIQKMQYRYLWFLGPIFSICSLSFPQSKSLDESISKTLIRVPFVGCESDGQVGPLETPKKQTKAVSLPTDLAQRLAFYKAEEGIGVLAPRGWHCFSTYGSNGSSLFVSPNPINVKALFSPKWRGFNGEVVQVSISIGGTSGRFAVAKTIARVFPDYRAFVREVIAEGIEPANSFPSGPYPSDKLAYRSKNVVEFETPADTKGLGANSWLQPNSTPIKGVAILSVEEMTLIQLSARLAEGDLTKAIVRQVEIDASDPNVQ